MNIQLQGRFGTPEQINIDLGAWFWALVQRLRWAVVPVAYLALTLVMAWPLPLNLTTQVPAGGDALLFLWDIWWFREAADAGTSPFHTTMLYHPNGVSTVFTTLASLESALTVPLQWLGLSPVVCLNLLLLGSSLAGALAAFALARRITGSALAAFIAGGIYGWSPYHSARVSGGHLNLASHQWLPLYILGMIGLIDTVWPGSVADGWQAETKARPRRSVRGQRRRIVLWSLLAGLAAAATAATELTYAAFLALWTVGYLFYRGWPLWRERSWRTLLRAALPLGGLVALAVTITSPILYSAGRELFTADSDYMYSSPQETLVYSADLLQYVIPNELHPLVPESLRSFFNTIAGTPNVAERIIAPGWTVLVLSLLGLALGWRKRGVRFWGWVLVAAAILSVGPVFHFAGRVYFTPFNVSLIMPYALLYELPGFAVMRAPLRFAILVSLAGAVLVAFALTELRVRWPRVGLATILLAGLLILAESVTTLPLTAVGPSAVTTAIRNDPIPGAVLDLPLDNRIDYLWLQTQHGRPIVGGYLARQPPDRFVENTPAVRYFLPEIAATDLALMQDGQGLQALQQAGVRYVVIHWWAVPEGDKPALAQKVGTIFAGQAGIAVPHEGTSYYLVPPAPDQAKQP